MAAREVAGSKVITGSITLAGFAVNTLKTAYNASGFSRILVGVQS